MLGAHQTFELRQVMVVAESISQLVRFVGEDLHDRRPDRLEYLDRIAQILRPLAPLVQVLDRRIVVRKALCSTRAGVDPDEAGLDGRPSSGADRPLGETGAHPTHTR